MEPIKKFWTFVRERETIRERKENGAPRPYTEDPRLQDYRFPNIRRSDDPATVWLHGGMLRYLDGKPESQIQAAVLFRAFGGSVETGEAIASMYFGSGWDQGLFLGAVGPLKTPFSSHVPRHLRMGTLADIAAAGCDVARQFGYWPLLRGASLCDAHRALTAIPKMGPELAYEVVCDLRKTPVLRDARDGATWAHPGTSAVLAAGTITDNDWRHTRRDDRRETILLMQALLAEAAAHHHRRAVAVDVWYQRLCPQGRQIATRHDAGLRQGQGPS